MSRHEPAAASARNSVPLLEPHEGARWVIGFEDLPDRDEEVIQPPFGEGTADHSRAFPFAQTRVAYMRMSHFGVMLWGARLKSDDVIGHVFPDLGPVQDDPKTAQAHIVQHNRIGHDLDRFLVEIDFDPIKIFG